MNTTSHPLRMTSVLGSGWAEKVGSNPTEYITNFTINLLPRVIFGNFSKTFAEIASFLYNLETSVVQTERKKRREKNGLGQVQCEHHPGIN